MESSRRHLIVEDMTKRVGHGEGQKPLYQFVREFPSAWINGKYDSKFCILEAPNTTRRKIVEAEI